MLLFKLINNFGVGWAVLVFSNSGLALVKWCLCGKFGWFCCMVGWFFMVWEVEEADFGEMEVCRNKLVTFGDCKLFGVVEIY